MLECYLEQQEALRTTLVLMDRNDLLILTDKNELIKEIISALQAFEAVTTEVSGKNTLAFQKSSQFRKHALQKITASNSTRGTISSISSNLITGKAHRFLNMEENPLAAFATLLDPWFKKVTFTNKPTADNMITTVNY